MNPKPDLIAGLDLYGFIVTSFISSVFKTFSMCSIIVVDDYHLMRSIHTICVCDMFLFNELPRKIPRKNAAAELATVFQLVAEILIYRHLYLNCRWIFLIGLDGSGLENIGLIIIANLFFGLFVHGTAMYEDWLWIIKNKQEKK